MWLCTAWILPAKNSTVTSYKLMNFYTLSNLKRTSRHVLIACATNREGQEMGLNNYDPPIIAQSQRSDKNRSWATRCAQPQASSSAGTLRTRYHQSVGGQDMNRVLWRPCKDYMYIHTFFSAKATKKFITPCYSAIISRHQCHFNETQTCSRKVMQDDCAP